MTIRAHFDGSVIVPDEPVDLPVDAPLELEVKKTNGVSPEVAAAMEASKDPKVRAARLAALDRFIALGETGTNIPLEMLRREHLYDDRV